MEREAHCTIGITAEGEAPVVPVVPTPTVTDIVDTTAPVVETRTHSIYLPCRASVPPHPPRPLKFLCEFEVFYVMNSHFQSRV